MRGEGTQISCSCCGKTYELDELGFLRALEGETEFAHVPDWYAWERACVREKLLNGSYRMEAPVDICMAIDTTCIYRVGHGILTHTASGLHLTGCDGKLDYHHAPLSSYSLYSDFNWYEIGDVICIGDHNALYYCFPQGGGDVVAKARLAAEELFKISMAQRREHALR